MYIYMHAYTHIHTYNGIVLSHKKKLNNAICSSKDKARDHHTKLSRKDKNKYHLIPLICGI